METVEFTFKIPKCCVDLLEMSECCDAEDILEKHFRDWWFSKTHHEADLILRGKHKRIEQDEENMDIAMSVKNCVCADACEVPLEDLGIDPDEGQEMNRLRAETKAMPVPPMPSGNFGEPTGREKWLRLLIEKMTDEEKQMSQRDFLKKKVKEMEASEAFKDYQDEVEEWQEKRQKIEAFDRNFRAKFSEHVEANRFKPSVERL